MKTNKLLYLILGVIALLFIFSIKSYASEDIYDVVLFWGQSNMTGYAGGNAKEQITDSRIERTISGIKDFSARTGIDEEILNKYVRMNYVAIDQEEGTAYEYKYATNELKEITSKTKKLGELLKCNYDAENNKTTLKSATNSGDYSLQESYGTNIIPQFCKTYYQLTGHKVVAILASNGGEGIANFLPSYDDGYGEKDKENKQYIYEAMMKKYNAAINYLKENNYTIGNQLYVCFQGEQDAAGAITTTNTMEKVKDTYIGTFEKVHDYLKTDTQKNNLGIGISKGIIIETSCSPGSSEVTLNPYLKRVAIHNAQEELAANNTDIIIGSRFAWKNFIPIYEVYKEVINQKLDIDMDIKDGLTEAEYNEKLSNALLSVCYRAGTDSPYSNSIHFTSAALSQMGKEAAQAGATLSQMEKEAANCVEVSSWGDLKSKIEEEGNYKVIKLTSNKEDKTIIADDKITIQKEKNVVLVADENIIIKRKEDLADTLLYNYGTLEIRGSSQKNPIIIDGNKNAVAEAGTENVTSLIVVKNGATLNINNVDLRNNEKTNGNQGGAIYSEVDSGNAINNITIKNCTIQNNNVQNTKNGGGIYLGHTNCAIVGSQVSYNNAGKGGGIYICNSSEVTISNTKIDNNTVNSTIYEDSNKKIIEVEGKGGGILSTTNSNLTLRNVIIKNNKAISYTYTSGNETKTVQGQGGGIYSSSGNTLIENSTEINGNEAGCGGGIYTTSTTICQISNSIIKENKADRGGGIYACNGRYGTVNVEKNVTITENQATESGGGVDFKDVGVFTFYRDNVKILGAQKADELKTTTSEVIIDSNGVESNYYYNEEDVYLTHKEGENTYALKIYNNKITGNNEVKNGINIYTRMTDDNVVDWTKDSNLKKTFAQLLGRGSGNGSQGMTIAKIDGEDGSCKKYFVYADSTSQLIAQLVPTDNGRFTITDRTSTLGSSVLGHANDATYNPNEQAIYVVCSNKNRIIKIPITENGTFGEYTTINIKDKINFAGIAYIGEENGKSMYLGTSQVKQYESFAINIGYIKNDEFIIEKCFVASKNLTGQGIGYHDGKVYVTCTEGGNLQIIYNNKEKYSNLIYVYDIKNITNSYAINDIYSEGKIKNEEDIKNIKNEAPCEILYIPKTEIKGGEIESVDFDEDGNMIANYNLSIDGTYAVRFYKLYKPGWQDLKERIEESEASNIEINLSDIKEEKWRADSCITIPEGKTVTLTANDTITILRDESFKGAFFINNGTLNINGKDAENKIIFDGNKENVEAENRIIQVEGIERKKRKANFK